MAQKAEIKIVFDSLPAIDSEISIELRKSSDDSLVEVGGVPVVITQVAKASRQNPNEYTIGATTEETTTNLKNAIALDYDDFIGVEVTDIEDPFLSQYELFAINYDRKFVYTGSNSGITVTITEEVIPPFSITSTNSVAPDTNICLDQRVNIVTDGAVFPVDINYSYDGIPQQKTASDNSQMFVDVERFQPSVITLTNSTSATDSVTPPNVKRHYIEKVDVTVTASTGEVIIVDGLLNEGISTGSLTYSINGVDYTGSDTFTGVAEGNYTAYIKDGYGCVTQLDFTVASAPDGNGGGETTITKTISYKPIDEINYIDFIENQVTGDLLCYWTDGVNPPFKVNISWLLESASNNYEYVQDMLVAKTVPPEPSIIPYRDYSYNGVSLQDSIYQFATRYTYNDGEKTPLSTYSKSAFYPKLDGETTLVGGVNGYYVDAGDLYSISGFDDATSQVISTGYDTGYDRIHISGNQSVFIMSSSTNSLPVLYSYNEGLSFVASDFTGIVNFVDISVDGDYVYISGSDKYLVSSDRGKTFTQLDSAGGPSYSGIMRCSDSGEQAVYIKHLVSDPSFDKWQLYVLSDYGQNELYSFTIITYFTTTRANIDDFVINISPDGRYLLYTDPSDPDAGTSELYIKDNSDGIVVIQHNLSTIPGDGAILDDGEAWVDQYRVYNEFVSIEAFDAFDRIWLMNSGFVTKNGTTFTRYDEFGTAENSGTLAYTPSYITGTTSSQALKNISNFYNTVDVWIETPRPYVESVEVYAINTSDGTTYLIKELTNNTDIFPSGEPGIYITFRDNLIYKVLSPTEKSILYSNVPLKAQCQSLIGNRLFYANYNDGRSLPEPNMAAFIQTYNIESHPFTSSIQTDTTQVLLSIVDGTSIRSGDSILFSFAYNDANGNIQTSQFKHVFDNGYNIFGGEDFVDIDIELNKTFQTLFSLGTVTASHNTTEGKFELLFSTGDSNLTFEVIYESKLTDNLFTWRKGRSQQIGIVYYDKYNRGSFPLFDDANAIIPDNINEPWVSIIIDIYHTPPLWAEKYKLVRTDRNLYYTIIPGFRYVKALNGYIFLMKQEGELFLPDAGTYLEVHDNNGDLQRMPVISKETKDADFVLGAPAGEWISIKDPRVDGLSAQSVLAGNSLYSTSLFYAVESLETVDDLLYYEMPGVYGIVDGKHLGTISNQGDVTPAQLRINDANVAYISDLGVEINSTSTGQKFWNGGRALVKTEQAGEVNRYAAITWSDRFVQDSGYNGLSTFNLGTTNWKELEISRGSINAVLALDTNLNIWQEDQVGYVLINKNAITTALGEDAVTQSNQVAGQFVPYAGEYGTLHPRSVAHYGNIRYFVDTKRDSICRISQDGISEISMQNMATEFHRVLTDSDNYIAAFNIDHKELWVYSKNEQLIYVYDEKAKGWTRYFEPGPVNGMLADNKNVFTIYDRLVYCQLDGTGYGNINGSAREFEFEYVQNAEPGMIKLWNTSELESNKPIKTIISIGGSYNTGETFNEAIIEADAYETREGEYFAYIPGAYNVDLSIADLSITEGGVIVPVGEIESVSTNTMTLKRDFFEPIGEVKHSVFVIDNDGTPLDRGIIPDFTYINGREITSTSTFSSSDVGKVAFLVENSYINGHKIRAPFVRIKFTDSDSEKLAIFANRLEVIESKNQ